MGDLRTAQAENADRIRQLEQLVRDLHDALGNDEVQLYWEFDTTGIDYDDRDNPTMRGFEERMEALGIEVGR